VRTFLVFLAVFGVALLGLAAYLGLFLSVSISEEDRGPFTFVYQPVSRDPGEPVDVQTVGQVTDDIAAMLDGIGLTVREPLQVYQPDGAVEVGFSVDADIRGLRLSNGTTMRVIPRQSMLATRFPWRHATSFMLGDLKVNPALKAYRESNNLAETEAMTLYEGSSILYLQPAVTR
jgi:hypothetical protein